MAVSGSGQGIGVLVSPLVMIQRQSECCGDHSLAWIPRGLERECSAAASPNEGLLFRIEVAPMHADRLN
jgi:hypothetical protein